MNLATEGTEQGTCFSHSLDRPIGGQTHRGEAFPMGRRESSI